MLYSIPYVGNGQRSILPHNCNCGPGRRVGPPSSNVANAQQGMGNENSGERFDKRMPRRGTGERFDKRTPETEETEPGERFDKRMPRGRVRLRNDPNKGTGAGTGQGTGQRATGNGIGAESGIGEWNGSGSGDRSGERGKGAGVGTETGVGNRSRSGDGSGERGKGTGRSKRRREECRDEQTSTR